MAVVLAVVAAGWYLMMRPAQLDRSILGLKGFANIAKKQNQLDIRFFSGQGKLNPKEIGLRILPLYDPNIYQFNRTKSDADLNKVEMLRQMSSYVFFNKIKSIKTLVVLPKWRDGARRLEKLHPELLIGIQSMRLPHNSKSKIGGLEIRRGESKFGALILTKNAAEKLPKLAGTSTVALYAAQTISTNSFGISNCTPVLLTELNEMLLARCSYTLKKAFVEYWLLSDPDLINNHGVGNGNNYQFALDLVKALAKGKPIIVDGTTRVFSTSRKTSRERDRSFTDLARFFTFPFAYFWAALVGLIVFTLWHAWRRRGPIIDRQEQEAMVASKASVIEANVAIIRSPGIRSPGKSGAKDIPLALAYIAQRLQFLGREVFGSSRKSGIDGELQLFTALERRNSSLSKQLKKARETLTPDCPSKTLFTTLNEFENLMEEARHEFGRTSNPRR